LSISLDQHVDLLDMHDICNNRVIFDFSFNSDIPQGEMHLN